MHFALHYFYCVTCREPPQIAGVRHFAFVFESKLVAKIGKMTRHALSKYNVKWHSFNITCSTKALQKNAHMYFEPGMKLHRHSQSFVFARLAIFAARIRLFCSAALGFQLEKTISGSFDDLIG